MRILLSFESFDAFGGTESYTTLIAKELATLGHDAPIYTRRQGAMAEVARAQGVTLIGRDQLPAGCDAILAQDAAGAYELAARYPGVPLALVAHSRDYALQFPPQQPGVCDAVIVMNDRVGAWVTAQATHPPVLRLRQPIDLLRFLGLGSASERARRVLVSSNYVDGARAQLISDACSRAGLELSWIGITSRPEEAPERAISNADIVIGLGRTALEAMAAGRAAYIYGPVGGDGWVTPATYERLEADGFSGAATGSALDAAALARDLAGWNRDIGEAGRDLIAAHHGVREHVVQLVEILMEAATRRGLDPAARDPASADHARLVRLEWQATVRAMRAALDANQLRAERDILSGEHERAVARVAELDRHLEDARARIAELEGLLARADAGPAGAQWDGLRARLAGAWRAPGRRP